MLVGQKVVCIITPYVVGTIIKFYKPTGAEEQIMVLTKDGRKYHAPVSAWRPYLDGPTLNLILFDERI